MPCLGEGTGLRVVLTEAVNDGVCCVADLRGDGWWESLDAVVEEFEIDEPSLGERADERAVRATPEATGDGHRQLRGAQVVASSSRYSSTALRFNSSG